MPMSHYVQQLRTSIGNSLLLLPAVTAVIHSGGKFLIARQRDTSLWSLVGGGVEPYETPEAAIAREVAEELAVTPRVSRVVGAYGGPDLAATYPNGDQVSYVTVAYKCELPYEPSELEQDELIEIAWHDRATIGQLPRHTWIDRVLDDAARQ